jgi:hypothetical protein
VTCHVRDAVTVSFGMNIALWITQILLIVVFGYSALIKGTQSTERAVELGMTGVVNCRFP